MILPIVSSQMENRTYLVADDATRRAFVIDPGVDTAPITQAIEKHRLEPTAVVLTHGHYDHIAGIPALQRRWPVPVWIHRDDAPMLREAMLNGAWLFGAEWTSIEPERILEDGAVLSLDALRMSVIHTPGHSPGSVTFAVNGDEALLTGDLLFRGTVGRTDLPGGDTQHLMRSLRRLMKEFANPPIYPGHGQASTLDAERRSNPFVAQALARAADGEGGQNSAARPSP